MGTSTQDLSLFGWRERDMAGDLLKALGRDNDKTRFLGNDVRVEFNPNSGNVFLVDGDYNVAMMNGEDLEDWFFCLECGHEGFREDMPHKGNKGCKQYLADIERV